MKRLILLLLGVFTCTFAQEQNLSDLRFLNLSNSRVYIILGVDGLHGLYVHPYGVGRFSEISKSELIENGYTVLLVDKGIAVAVGSNDSLSKELENGDILVLDDKTGVFKISYMSLSTYLQQKENSTKNCNVNSLDATEIESIQSR